jgi:hypothetical protein
MFSGTQQQIGKEVLALFLFKSRFHLYSGNTNKKQSEPINKKEKEDDR